MSATLEQVDLVGGALRYAKAGRGVFPIHTARDGACSCPIGSACERPGKHPRTRRGWHDASVDPQEITGWWERWPDANIGLVTGGRLGVLDVDPRSGGDESFSELHQCEPLQEGTPTVRTGSGGTHHYITVPAGTRTTVLAPGIDLKADGGYVIAPPSLHVCGGRYHWVLEGRATPAPSWALTQAATSTRPVTETEEWVRVLQQGAHAGSRNTTATRLAGHLARRYVAPEVVLEVVLLWNERRCQPPMTDREVRAVVGNVLQLEARRRASR